MNDEFGATTTWRPDQGQHPRTISGKLLDVRSASGNYGEYPLLEIEQDDGVTWSVHAFRDVLQSELASVAPQLGDKVSISYGGRHEKGYYLYRVRKLGAEPTAISWGKWGGDPPPEPDVPVDASDLPPAVEGKSIADRAAEEYGDDVPFT